MDKRRQIEVNSSSLVGLKAELLRKQEEFKKEKLEKSSTFVKPTTSSSSKKNASIWSKKKQRSGQQEEKDVEEIQKERDELDKSRAMLEAKTKLYEQMTSGNDIPDEETNSLFLVDFEKKQLDKVMKKRNEENGIPRTLSGKGEDEEDEEDVLAPESDIPAPSNPDEEWVDYTDTLGRSRRCMKKDLPLLIKMDKNLNPEKFKEESSSVGPSQGDDKLPEMMSSDMHRERMRKKWEAEQEELMNRGQDTIHYQNVRFDEVRTHGVGYFDFAKDQTTREEQLNTLKYLRDETVDKRTKREELKAKRKAALAARLEKVRQRKKIKVEDVDVGEEKEVAEQKTEEKEERIDPNWQRTLRLVEAAKKESSRDDREWDENKVPRAWAEERSRIRNARPSEFAPPTDYTPLSKKKGKSNKAWRQNVERPGQEGDRKEDSGTYGQTVSGQRSFVNIQSSSAEESSPCEDVSVTAGPVHSEPGFKHQSGVNWNYGDVTHSNASTSPGTHDGLRSSNISMSEERLVKESSGHHARPSLSNSKKGEEQADWDEDSSAEKPSQKSSDADGAESNPTPLIRTENSKPIKFSIGFGSKKPAKELPSSGNVLDTEEEIKNALSFFRNQASQ